MTSFSAMKLIKNWFGMGCEVEIWVIADDQQVPQKWCLLAVASPTSVSQVAQPQGSVCECAGIMKGVGVGVYQTKKGKKKVAWTQTQY